MRDFLEHICTAPGAWLEAIAQQFPNNGKNAIDAAATELKDLRQDCFDHFWEGPDQLDDADFCDTTYDGFFDHDPWEPGITIDYTDPITNIVISSVSNIIVSPRSNFGSSVPVAPPNPADTCLEVIPNDGEIPPLATIDPSKDLFSPVASVDVELDGPVYNGEMISGSGEFGTDSDIQWRTYGSSPQTLDIDYWSMVEHATTSVGTSSISSSVDNFHMTLMQSSTATPVAGGWEFAAGDVAFNLEAVIDGIGSSVQAFNSTAIDLEVISGGIDDCPLSVSTSCLVSGQFSIEYEDAFGDPWVLDVDAVTWKP